MDVSLLPFIIDYGRTTAPPLFIDDGCASTPLIY